MAVLPVLRWPDPRLSQRATPVAQIDAAVRSLAQDMLDTMYAAKGRGLAGPQVGQMHRVFVMDETWKEGRPQPVVAINPDILWRSDVVETGPEGCLSIPGISAMVPRHTAVRVRWTDLAGNTSERLLTGFAAVCAQHEIDHLDGIVTFDRVSPADRFTLLLEYGA